MIFLKPFERVSKKLLSFCLEESKDMQAGEDRKCVSYLQGSEIRSDQISCSVVSDSLRPHESQHARPPCPLPTPGVHSNSTSIESVIPSSHLILCRPLLLPPIPPSIRVFSNESALCIRWPKSWSFSLSLSKEYSGLISFRMDWFDLLAIQGTLKTLL